MTLQGNTPYVNDLLNVRLNPLLQVTLQAKTSHTSYFLDLTSYVSVFQPRFRQIFKKIYKLVYHFLQVRYLRKKLNKQSNLKRNEKG